MSRYIDADKLIDRLDTDEYGMRLPKAVVGLTKVLLDEAPTIDAVSVVRCKECKHNKTSDCAMWYEDVTYEMQYSWNNPNDYCSYGERSDT